MANQNPQEGPIKKFDEVLEMKKRKEFSTREVGMTHPDNSGFFRISDSGDIEIFAAPGVGIVINPSTRSVSIFADSIKFFCREDDGLRWNSMSFNPASDVYNEPALVKTNDFLNNPAYFRTSHYLNNLDKLDEVESEMPVTIVGNYGLRGDSLSETEYESDNNSLTFEQKKLVEDFAKTNSESNVSRLVELLEKGYEYFDAVQKINTGNITDSDNLENFPWITND